jgi:hypothetical protein
MRRYFTTASALVVLLALSVAPTGAQDYQSSVGWNVGALMSTGLNDGAADGGAEVELKPDLTWALGAHWDRWVANGQVGFRVQGGVARPVLPWTQGDRKIQLLVADVGILLRPVAPSPGGTVLPFIGAGVGLINWGLGDGPATTFGPAGASYPGKEKPKLMAVAGLGIDLVTPFQWGEGPLVLRVEGRNHIQFTSPFDPSNPEQGDFGMIHNAVVSVGFHTGIGNLGGSR